MNIRKEKVEEIQTLCLELPIVLVDMLERVQKKEEDYNIAMGKIGEIIEKANTIKQKAKKDPKKFHLLALDADRVLQKTRETTRDIHLEILRARDDGVMLLANCAETIKELIRMSKDN